MNSDTKIGSDLVPSGGSRGKSTIEFPYGDLDDAEEVVTAVHAVGGVNCQWDQLAAKMGQSASGGGFRLRVGAARTFALLTYERGEVELTDLGIRLLDPKSTRAARAEAFLKVPLFKAAYDKFKGIQLPPPAAIERQFEQLGVAPKQKDKARLVFMRSAKTAGYFELASDRLVAPALGAQSNDRFEDATQGEDNNRERRDKAANIGSAANDQSGIPAALIGLLQKLPPPGKILTPKRRKALTDAFASTINFLYPEEEDEDEEGGR